MSAILRLLPLIAQHRRLFAGAVVWAAFGQLAVLAIAVGLAFLVGRALAGIPLDLPLVSVLLLAAAIVAAGAAWRESWVAHDLAYRLIALLRGRVFTALHRALPRRRDARRTGDLATTVTADIETLEWLYAHTVAQVLSAVLVLAGSAALSATISPWLLLVWPPLLVLGVAVSRLTARRARRDGEAIAAGSGELRAELLDTVRGLRELVGADALDAQLERVAARSRSLAHLQAREASRLGFERAIGEGLVSTAALGALLLVLAQQSTIDPALVPVAVAVAVAGLGPAAQIADLLRSAGTLRAAAVRLAELLDLPPSVPSGGAGRAPDTTASPTTPQVGLVLEDVGFTYAPGGAPILEGCSMRIRPGETVALTGPSGAGKTTLARLVLRYWDPDAGRILLDGVDLRELDDAELRRRIAVVPQGSPLLRGTVRSNVLLGDPEANDEAVGRAAEAAGLFDPEVGLPRGLDTPIGEHGTGLSGGQRARVAIARALLREPRVLVLDEATASLDPEADAAITSLVRQSPTRCILLIAHRPETIAAADREYALPVLERGSGAAFREES